MYSLCCLTFLIFYFQAINASNLTIPLTLENILIEMKSSPPLTAAEFLSNLMSHYVVPIYSNSQSEKPEINPNDQNEVFREYLTDDIEPNENVKWQQRNPPKRLSNEYSLSGIPMSANCEPEMRTIHLQPLISEKSPAESNDIFFPHCIRISQCGGCCPSKRLACEPSQTKQELISVMHVRFSSTNRRFQYQGTKQISIVKHLACSCQCIQKQYECRNDQLYRPEECRCICPTEARFNCLERQYNSFGGRYIVWNNQECSCQCLPPPRYRRCPSGFRFNTKRCSCDRSLTSNELRQTSPHERVQIRYA